MLVMIDLDLRLLQLKSLIFAGSTHGSRITSLEHASSKNYLPLFYGFEGNMGKGTLLSFYVHFFEIKTFRPPKKEVVGGNVVSAKWFRG